MPRPRGAGDAARICHAKKGSKCICQICLCGRHSCPYYQPEWQMTPAEKQSTEYKEMFYPKGDGRQPSCKPLRNNDPVQEAMEDLTIQRQDFRGQFTPRPDSFKPDLDYRGPCQPIEGNTTYNVDFPPKEGHKRKAIKPQGKITDHRAPLCDKTQNRVSFRPYNPAEAADAKPPACRPANGLHDVEQPMNSDTTNRVDFCRKPICVNRVHAPHDLHTSDQPLDDRTMYRHDYPAKEPPCKETVRLPEWQPPLVKMDGRTIQRTHFTPKQPDWNPSYKPVHQYERPEQPMDDRTTQKDSFKPNCPREKEEYPWMKKQPYRGPCAPLDANSIYVADFGPKKGHRPPPAKPPAGPIKDRSPLLDATTYRKDFVPRAQDRTLSCKPDREYAPPERPIDSDTTYKNDYAGCPGRRPDPYLPNTGIPSGTPMDLRTTHKMTFVPLRCPAEGLSSRENPCYSFVNCKGEHEVFEKSQDPMCETLQSGFQPQLG